MDILIGIFLALHIIGIGALLGGFLVQMKAMRTGEARIVPAILHGAGTMLVTGLILVGLNEADGADLNHIKITVKLVVLVALTALAYLKRDDERVPPGVFGTIGLLTIANIFIATLW
ncbi:hypothetical protein GCM10009716_31770 [Streptomyces sodiiphilus]|uniref:Integral membrane protein n=1 Tax=Streptomyces sodiiphilus TaxID=226217 RepID=A0ABN2PJM2_9ACTN